MRIEADEGRPEATLLAIGNRELVIMDDSAIEDFRVSGRAVRFTMKVVGEGISPDHIPVVAYRPSGEGRPEELIGSMEYFFHHRVPVKMERTDRMELDPEEGYWTAPGRADWERFHTVGVEEMREVFEEILDRYAGQPIAFTAATSQLYRMVLAESPEDEVRAVADQAIALAAPYGPELELFTAHRVAWGLVETDTLNDLAVEYARRAEAMLRPSVEARVRVSVLKTLSAALWKTGRKEDAKAYNARIVGLDDQLIQENPEPFPELLAEPFLGRRGGSDRAVLVELFTTVSGLGCVDANQAFDALIWTYNPKDLVLVQYHLFDYGFDALTNRDGEARARFYGVPVTPSHVVDGTENVPGTPSGFIDDDVFGLPERPPGAPWLFIDGDAMRGYNAPDPDLGFDDEDARELIEQRMEVESPAGLELRAERDGDRLLIRAGFTRLKRTGDAVRLRLLLVEDVVRYEGDYGQQLRRHVVRDFPGGIDGFALKDEPVDRVVNVDLDDVVEDLNRFLEIDRFQFPDGRYYPDNERPIDFGPLKVVAVIQDDATKEVLQAVQVDVTEAR